MISLSTSESSIVFAALIRGFRPDRRGRYRGPATYRGGDNPTALSIDVSKGGAYYDHVTGEGGDAVKFVQVVRDCDFVDACRFISGMIGRSLLGDGSQSDRPRFTQTELSRAALFATGYAWHLEQHLELVKQLWLLNETAVKDGEISRLTRLLAATRSWTPYEACEFLQLFVTGNGRFVAGCIASARQSQMLLAELVSTIGQQMAVAA